MTGFTEFTRFSPGGEAEDHSGFEPNETESSFQDRSHNLKIPFVGFMTRKTQKTEGFAASLGDERFRIYPFAKRAMEKLELEATVVYNLNLGLKLDDEKPKKANITGVPYETDNDEEAEHLAGELAKSCIVNSRLRV